MLINPDHDHSVETNRPIYLVQPGRASHAKYFERMDFYLEDGMYALDLKGGVMKDMQI